MKSAHWHVIILSMRKMPKQIWIGISLIAVVLANEGYKQVDVWLQSRGDGKAIIAPAPEGIAKAYFAGGCFWCTEADFEKMDGVTEVISGYQGGYTKNPTYADVTKDTTGHREAVEVRYNPTKVTYTALVQYFFSHIDPTDEGGSFSDRGESYTSAVFYQSEGERQIIDAELARLHERGAYAKPIVTAILPFAPFWVAEESHQDYYKKNTLRYEYYRNASGRDERIGELCAYRLTKSVACD